MKISRIVIVVLAVILGLDLLVLIGVAFFDSAGTPEPVRKVIRIGIIPDPDRPETEKTIQAFFADCCRAGDSYELRPCYTHSYEEAMAGFTHGTLDLLALNPACYLQLKRENLARILAVQKYSEEDKRYNHAVLLSVKPFRHLSATRGSRIAFSHRYSMNGYMVPYRYLQRQLPEAPERWFSSLTQTGTFRRSFEQLQSGQVDLIAVDLGWLKHFEPYRSAPDKFHILWLSPELPESVICVGVAGAYFGASVVRQFVGRLWEEAQRNAVFNRNSMAFEPENFNYETALRQLEIFLYGDIKNTDGQL
ncbi:MAG: PhnD/SsuA/transferrin family substrate-binding protein [Victivallales bacterium]|nr:PhnD/SsuA/transferrin family substrate-binding protein [Victivallales bacterium]